MFERFRLKREFITKIQIKDKIIVIQEIKIGFKDSVVVASRFS